MPKRIWAYTMEMELNLELPEWAFLNGSSHLGNTLEGRDILQHNHSHTIFELFLLDDEEPIEEDPSVINKVFTFNNIWGETETHLIVVHFTLISDSQLDEIMDKAIKFYKEFMDWEDASLIIEETSKDN